MLAQWPYSFNSNVPLVPELHVLPEYTAMQATFELTQRDFLDSFLAHRNRTLVSKWGYRLLGLMALVFFGISLLAAARRPNAQTVADVIPAFGLSVFLAAMVWGLPWWMARTQFLKQPAAQGPRTMVVDSTGVHWRWNGGSADIEWKNFIRRLECKTEFLLYTSPACFNMVPKRALTPEQQSEFTALLAQQIPAG